MTKEIPQLFKESCIFSAKLPNTPITEFLYQRLDIQVNSLNLPPSEIFLVYKTLTVILKEESQVLPKELPQDYPCIGREEIPETMC